MLRVYLYNTVWPIWNKERSVVLVIQLSKKKNRILQEKKINIDALRSEAAGWAELGWGGCSSAQLLFPFAPLSFPCSQLTLPPPTQSLWSEAFKQYNDCCAHLRSTKMHQGPAAPPICSPVLPLPSPVAKGQGGMGGVVLSTEEKVRTRKCTCEEGRTWG